MSKNRMITWAGVISIFVAVIAGLSSDPAHAQGHTRTDRKISQEYSPYSKFFVLDRVCAVGYVTGQSGVSRTMPPVIYFDPGVELVGVNNAGASCSVTLRDKVTGNAETIQVDLPFSSGRVRWTIASNDEIQNFLRSLDRQ